MYVGKVWGSRVPRKGIGQSFKSVGHLHMVDMHEEEVQMGKQSHGSSQLFIKQMKMTWQRRQGRTGGEAAG